MVYASCDLKKFGIRLLFHLHLLFVASRQRFVGLDQGIGWYDELCSFPVTQIQYFLTARVFLLE